jgi:precorrin isomerase
MDSTTEALLAIHRDVGELRGEMTGIGREIGDIKKLLECKTNDCRACREGIDQDLQAQADLINTRIDQQNAKIRPIENLHRGEAAVRSWKDRTLGEIATMIGAAAGIVALAAWIVRGILTGDWT